ncbi:MAG TPA: L,D-transpeptidase [Solirubrobacteraceae bacterium]
MRRGLALALLILAWAPGGAAASEVPAGAVRVSDERTLSRWGHASGRHRVRDAPRAGAHVVGHLRMLTEDGFPEVYLVLRAWNDPEGRRWFQVRLPMRPNGTTGWLPEFRLSELHAVRTSLVVDRQRQRATLRRRGRRIWSSRVGVGAPVSPTPRGRFYVREHIRTRDPGGIYGPWAIGTSAYSVLSDWPGGGVVGIHGTNQPGLIPGRPSHGCIRVPNAKIRRLARLAPVGTPVRIR